MIFPNCVILSLFSVENHTDMLTCNELCHLESKMPFKIFRSILSFTRYYEGKSEMVSLYGGNFGFSRQSGCCSKNKKKVSPRKQETLTNAV